MVPQSVSENILLSGLSPQVWLNYDCMWENLILVEDTHGTGGLGLIRSLILVGHSGIRL